MFIGVLGIGSAVPAQAASGTPITNDVHVSTANPRLVRITHGAAKGTIVASVAPGVIYQSTDEGSTFTKLTEIQYPSTLTWQCCGVLYELPRTVGSISAGTLLFSASFCEGNVASMPIFSSSDDGHTWTFLAEPVSGGECIKDKEVQGDGLWEPDFEVASDGALVMFWSDETDPCCSQKLSQIRTYDGMTWQDKKDTVASDNHTARPGMAVVSKVPSGKYFMTYELCGTANCDVMYRTSDDGWNFGSQSNMGTKIVTASGRYFEHAPRNIWFQPDDSKDGTLVVAGQVLYEKDGTVSPQDGEVLFANSSKDGAGKWTSIPAPVKVPHASAPHYNVCQNYSSSLLPVKDGSALLEMASDWNANPIHTCTSYYASEPWPNTVPGVASLALFILLRQTN